MLRLKIARVGTLMPPREDCYSDGLNYRGAVGAAQKNNNSQLSTGQKVNERDGREQGSLSTLICSNRVTCARSR